MELQKSALSIIRALSILDSDIYYASGEQELTKLSNIQRSILKILASASKEQKAVVVDIVKSAVLLTGGSIATVRDPSLFDKQKKIESWADISGSVAIRILKTIAPELKLSNGYPTKQDYEKAKALLPIIGSISMMLSDSKGLPNDPSGDLYSGEKFLAPKILYRGLKSVSENTVLSLMTPGTVWDISRGVSTSSDEMISKLFASVENKFGLLSSTDGPSVLFIINNEKRKGFVTGEVSRYAHEMEIILSGKMVVDEWELTSKVDFYYNNRFAEYTDLMAYGTGHLKANSKNEIFLRTLGQGKWLSSPIDASNKEILSQFLSGKIVQVPIIDKKSSSGIDTYKVKYFKSTVLLIVKASLT